MKRKNDSEIETSQPNKKRHTVRERGTRGSALISNKDASSKKYGIFEHMPVPGKHRVVGALRGLDNNPRIYAYNELDQLLQQIFPVKHNVYGKKCKVVRFLVKINGDIVFAKEGYPSGDVPAHYQMANANSFSAACITAGNAYFDDEHKLCILDHQSGDFRPAFDSLQFALDALVNKNIELSKNIQIKKLTKTGVFQASYSITAPPQFTPVNQDEIKITTTNDSRHEQSNSEPPIQQETIKNIETITSVGLFKTPALEDNNPVDDSLELSKNPVNMRESLY